MKNPKTLTTGALGRALTALALAVCLLVSTLPASLAASQAGTTADKLTRSTAKTYVRLSRSVLFFTGNAYGEGSTITPPAGTICQLYTDDWYTAADGRNYHGVYYMNNRYNVLRSDIVNDFMSDSAVETYITGTLWKQSAYDTLRQSMNLVGDIRVHAVQLALQKLGYYTGQLDGDYGAGTAQAIKKFQRAQGLNADGSAGPLTQPALFALASGTGSAGTITGTTGTGTTTGTTTGTNANVNTSGTSMAPVSGTLRTTASVNLRKSSSTSSARLAVVPKGINLAYSGTTIKNGVTWFQVSYNGLSGWLMGTFVSASGSSTSPAIGTVTITKPGTRVRDAANGRKTGTVLAKGAVVDLLAQPTTAANYTWYNIRTSSGLIGFVRGDCATASIGGSGSSGSSGSGTTGDLVISTERTFVRLPANTRVFQTEGMPATGYSTVSAGTVLMLYSTTTYTHGGLQYCSVYYNNKKYNALYSDIQGGIMTAEELSAYCRSLLSSTLTVSLKKNLGLEGDVRVYALQSALKSLGYYTGTVDGNYGSATYTAVRNFQRAASLEVDGACGKDTWSALNAKVNGSSGGTVTPPTTPTTPGSSVTVADFGTVTSVQKMSWDYGDNGGNIFPKGTYATVMDVQTGKVFQVYRWSGGSHADCVPASSNDTRTMCEIVGFPYNTNHPTSSQLNQIKKDGNSGTVTYTWPDFKNAFGGAKNIGSAWDRRPALLNVNGKVYCVSIYGFPHGFTGTDSFAKSKFPNGQYFYAANNYYGMMCVHFVGSTTHTSTTPDSKHQAAIDQAYAYAKKLWPTLCK